ncbi:MAG: ABC transporter substrate-binding protein [Burkholderiales bacterium]|nr:ABC transporter substrate-binding protein [Burkholderiales bacterium]
MKRRTLLQGAGAAAALGTVAGFPSIARGQAATGVKLTLPWLPLGTFSFAFVAKKIGAWDKRGLNVTIDRGFGSGAVCVPVDKGQYDFGIIDMAVMMNCAAKSLDLVNIASIWPLSPVGIFSLTDANISKPKDLEGKRVGFNVASGDFQLWPAFVRSTGIDEAKVRKVMMEPPALPPALINKQVDAIGNFIGSVAPSLWAQDLKISWMLYEDFGVKTASNCVATRSETIEKKPKLCQDFVDGLMEGLKYVYLNPDESVNIHLDAIKEFKDSQQNRDVIRYGQAISTALGMTPAFRDEGLGYIEPSLVEETRKAVETYMKSPGIPPADKISTNKFVGRVKLTAQEWMAVEKRSAEILPKRTA